MTKIPIGIIGATGMVGQKFVKLLLHHPWFEIKVLAASARSAGKPYGDALQEKEIVPDWVPPRVGNIKVLDAVADRKVIAKQADLAFCAVEMPKAETATLEEDYARSEVVVVSANSAHRWTPDVPMVIPEVNPGHLDIIPVQRQRLDTRRGCIVVKPNCSLQPYVLPLWALWQFEPIMICVTTYQALSGAGKTFRTWREMEDNVIPFIPGEEEKSAKEPMKIWGEIRNQTIAFLPEDKMTISAHCFRVPVSHGHLASVRVRFHDRPSREQILTAWQTYHGEPQRLILPSAPQPLFRYLIPDDRPQTRLDRNAGQGMAITLGRLEEDALFEWKFVSLSHNLVRGAAGGAILTAELMQAEGYI